LFRAAESGTSGRNQLIWGDNLFVMSSLLTDYAGKIRLIYIDPPFATGDDFSMRVQVGDSHLVKQPSILEEHAYRDTWGAGHESYLSMMYPRLVLLHELLAEDGSVYLHCAPPVSHTLRLICDEIFGTENFRNEIVWKRTSAHNDSARFGRVHDVLLLYVKSSAAVFNVLRQPLDQEYVDKVYTRVDKNGRRYRLDNISAPGGRGPVYEWGGITQAWRYTREKMEELYKAGRIKLYPDGKAMINAYVRYLDESEGRPVQDWWDDVGVIAAPAKERLGYPTQKPEVLLKRVIEASSNPGDLVADFFIGSGTTAAVAEKLDRRWIGCDLGRFAIHTTRKRLLDIRDCRPFDIKNLGSYERQRWQMESSNGALRAYLDTILAFYNAAPVEGFIHLHGRKANRMVHVGATDAPVTIDETEEVMDEMADNGIAECDLLGWEWEMGLHDTISERARRRGLHIRPRQIPREVMERQVVDANAVRFFELAFVDLDIRRQGKEACVVLKDFAIPSEELIPAEVRESVSSWPDLIDYWSVDYDFSDEIFHNEWQAYRTRENPALATQTDWHKYPKPGRYGLVVKIIDIFGNDTTKLAEVLIK
jgi:DNA modification methylase